MEEIIEQGLFVHPENELFTSYFNIVSFEVKPKVVDINYGGIQFTVTIYSPKITQERVSHNVIQIMIEYTISVDKTEMMDVYVECKNLNSKGEYVGYFCKGLSVGENKTLSLIPSLHRGIGFEMRGVISVYKA